MVSKLYQDLEEIGNKLVSLSLITDPFGAYDLNYLHSCFKDVLIPFKEHFVVDLSRHPNDIISRNHHNLSKNGLPYTID